MARTSSTSGTGRRHRQHRVTLRQLNRSALERAGWRTTLELRENHIRSTDGLLLDVETVWVAEAERHGELAADVVDVVSASARSESKAWARLLVAAESVDRITGSRREIDRLGILR